MRIPKDKEKVWTEKEYAIAQAKGHDIPNHVKEKFEDDTQTTGDSGE